MRYILDRRTLFDLKGLATRLFHPIQNFMTKEDALSVCETMRTSAGSHFFPLPILLRLNKQNLPFFETDQVFLCDTDQTPLAKFSPRDIFPWSIHHESQHSLGTTDKNHPYYQWLLRQEYTHAVSGDIEYLPSLTNPYSFRGDPWLPYFKTPEEVGRMWKERGVEQVVGFQTRNPLHRSHMAVIEQAVEEVMRSTRRATGALLHPVVGPTQETDIDAHTRVRLYEMALPHFRVPIELQLLPIHMRMAGPREALWHAIIRRNVGCTHFIVGRDHAGPTPKRADGSSFYGAFDAQELARKHEADLGIGIIPMKEMVYHKSRGVYVPSGEVPESERGVLSGTALREAIRTNREVPDWFSLPEVVKELRRVHREGMESRGVCFYAYGLSGSGKTTTLRSFIHQLRHLGYVRPLVLLDGDEVRREWSPELGFSQKDRTVHVRRMGRIARTIVEQGGVVFVANIAPFQADRDWNREHISGAGDYYEVFFDVGSEVCEARDPKGFYREKGREGMTGFFERPRNVPEFVVGSDADREKLFEFVRERVLGCGRVEK